MVGCLHIRWYENSNVSEMITVSVFRLVVLTTLKMEAGSFFVLFVLFTGVQSIIYHTNEKFIIILRTSKPSGNLVVRL
jgi:hypothetical protein